MSPSRTSSCSIPFSAHANGSATVARSEGSSGGQRDQVLRRDRRHAGHLGVRAGERVVAVQQVVLAQVLEPLEAPAARPAGEDRAEEHPVARRDARRQDGVGPDLGEHADGLVAELPRHDRLRVAVEERARVGAADAARLDPEQRAGRVERGSAASSRTSTSFTAVMNAARIRRAPPRSAASALSAGHRSRITRESARVIASGFACMKMFRPTEQPIAPASTACCIRVSSSASSRREPPASTTGMPFAASTHRANAVLVARPVRLHDVRAELGAQAHVPAQVLEPVRLLQLLDRRVGRRELGLGDERHAERLALAPDRRRGCRSCRPRRRRRAP